MSELRKKVERLLVHIEVELEAPSPVKEEFEEFDVGYEAAMKDIKDKLDFVLKE